MKLTDWRKRKKYSQSDLATRLGLAGGKGILRLSRIERGEVKCDADIAGNIIALTCGEVSLTDMHETRLAWLKENKPEQFETDEVAR